MIILNDIINELKFGDLSNVPPKYVNVDSLIYHINNGLMKLYITFPLSTKELLLELHKGVIYYKLDKSNARSNPLDTGEYKYIRDARLKPFTNDIISILGIYDMCQCELKINDMSDITSVFLTQYNIIQIPWADNGIYLKVSYRAKHAELNSILDQEIVIPEYLKEPLCNYVAFRVYSSIDSKANNAIDFYNKYNNLITEISYSNIAHNSMTSSGINFINNGWV